MEKKKKFYLSLKMRLLFLLFVIVIPLTSVSYIYGSRLSAYV